MGVFCKNNILELENYTEQVVQNKDPIDLVSLCFHIHLQVFFDFLFDFVSDPLIV